MLQTAYNRLTGRTAQKTHQNPGASFVKPPVLTDPKEADSELSPADLKTLPPEPLKSSQEAEQDTVNLVMRRFKESSEARHEHEREWLLSSAFARGNQWVEWRGATNRLESLVDPNDPYRTYTTAPLIGALLTKLKARATMSKPDASVKPLTPAPGDVAAADEGRDLLDHYDRLFDRQMQTQDWVDCALETSTSFLKIIWDAKKAAKVAYTDQAGQPVVAPAEIGDIDEILVPPYEVYPDPKARAWVDCGWLIHAKVRSLSYIQQAYGGKDNEERGWQVKGESENAGSSSSGQASSATAHMDAITGDGGRGSKATGKNNAIVYECWEKPSARFAKGRRIVVAGGVLLLAPDKLDWPYTKSDDFPFVALHYKKKFGSLWALNAVHDLIPLQRQYNQILSRLMDRINTDKPTILVPHGSEIGIDAYQSKRNFQKITHTPGLPPSYQAPPPVSEAWFSALNVLKGLMEDISGVHEVSNGSVPAGVTAGNAIELLQQSDTTQMAEFVGNIETAAKKRAEWELALATQFYAEPRLVGVSEENSPGQQQAAARSFEALKASGGVRVEVLPGSATPKTPAARIQQYMDMASKGMFQPEALPITKQLVDLMGLERSDIVTERLDAAIQQGVALQQASQPNPAAIEQVKGQQAQAVQAQQLQAQQAQQAAQSQQEAEMAAVQAHSQIEVQQAKLQGDLAIEQMKAQNALALQHMKDMNALDLAAHDRSTIQMRLSGNMDPTAVADAEKKAGLEGKIPPQPQMQPGSTQSSNTQPGNTNQSASNQNKEP